MAESLKGKTVLITGGSSGIGKACAELFAKEHSRILVCARRHDLLESLADSLRKQFNTDILAFTLDVRNHDEVISSIRSLPEEWRAIDILINNAGLSRGLEPFYNDDPQNWEEMIDTNVKGLLYVTHEVVKGMVNRQSGHIINIGSIAGHETYPKGSVYCPTKHAVSSITTGLRYDLLDKNIRVSTVDPGLVETNFSNIRFRGDSDRAGMVYKGITPLTALDVAETVLFTATRPKHVNIAETLILPSAQGSTTLVNRK
jgi:NADP-dependent 3-hydroxy acid dehydrogenase YdfG